MALKQPPPVRQTGNAAAGTVAAPNEVRPADGRTQPHQSQQKVPRLPHEHDESDDSQAHSETRPPDLADRKAYEDASQKKQDTSLSPVTNATYQRQK